MSELPAAIALGFRRTRQGKCLDVLYPRIQMDDVMPALQFLKSQGIDWSGKTGSFVLTDAHIQALKGNLDRAPLALSYLSGHLGNYQNVYSELDVILFSLNSLAENISSVEEAYFKLQMLSQRLVKPHRIGLDGLFGVLPNLAWTSIGPVFPEDLAQVQVQQLTQGNPLTVSHVDKFPYLVNYHVPSGVRIASGSQVRLGAYLSEGTTVMQAGFVNFNAGTQGKAMVEGRISAGVVIGDGTDVGGGASIMGTLSGGNQHVISLGPRCLLGANAGTGISLGFGCTVAAGLYVTAGTKVYVYDANMKPVDAHGKSVYEGKNIVKARELSGRDYLLFYTDSQTGRVVCKPNPHTIALNPALHG